MPKTVVVGMSGGVDSSLSAALLKEQGYRVIGLFMKNWEEKNQEGACHSAQDYEDVRRVCDHLDIPYYGVNFVEEYRTQVFASFIEELKKGRTPNPDILCNREIKFKVFLQKAIDLGADFLATGHYCQNVEIAGKNALLKGIDAGKDQTYFLYTIDHEILKKVLFPIGALEKSRVRELAKKYGLATAEKKDSTGICFIGKRNFKEFVGQFIAMQPGSFSTLDGRLVGKHEGAAYYTLGQRRGLGIGGPGEAWFVVGKEMEKGIVYVEQGTDHPALYCEELVATELSWISGEAPLFPLSCQSKVRYRQNDQPCLIQKMENGKLHVSFPFPQRAVTPGQSIVFYQNSLCLGGGIIEEAGPSFHTLKKTLPL